MKLSPIDRLLRRADRAASPPDLIDKPDMTEPKEAERLLRAAAAALKTARPELSEYQAKKEILAAFLAMCDSKGRQFHFSPETRLASPPYQGGCPDPTRRWEDLHELNLPRALVNTPTEQLPDGAILPVVRLLSLPTENARRFPLSDGSDFPVTLLERYGERCCPCLFLVLGEPERWVLRGLPAEYMRSGALAFAGSLPGHCAISIFRAALESGWHKSLQYLRDGSDKQALLSEYADSPYLHWTQRKA